MLKRLDFRLAPLSGVRSLLLATALAVLASPAWAAPSIVQQNTGYLAGASSLTVTLTNRTTVNNVLIMVGGIDANSLNTPSGGGVATWSKATASDANANCEIWYGVVTTSSSAGVTITISGSGYAHMNLTEWSGLNGTLDKAAAQSNTTSPASASSITTTNANDLLIFAAAIFLGNTAGPPTAGGTSGSWEAMNSIAVTGFNDVQSSWYQVVSATGTYNPTSAVAPTPSSGTDAAIAAFQVASCGTPDDPSYVAANAQSAQAIVYWASANSALILRNTASIATAPTNGTTYTAGNLIGTSTVIFDGTNAIANVTCTETSCTDTSVTTGTYYYKVFANSGHCYSPGTTTQVIARPGVTSNSPWSYNLAGGSTLVAGIAGTGTIYTGSNAKAIIGLNTGNGTPNGTQLWAPVATTSPIQAWLSWVPTYSGWAYRKAITIDHTKVLATLTNFPVLISITDAAGLGTYAQPSGNDIFFTAADGETKLAHEIEQYTSGTGQLIAWVQVPSLSSTADTVLYMYYGNSTAPNQQNVTGTWDANFIGVWHLKESGTGIAGEFKDSTTNANNGQGGAGTATAVPTQVTGGQIGAGQSFNGTSQYIQVPNSASLNPGAGFTMELWVNPTTTNGTKPLGMCVLGTGGYMFGIGGTLNPQLEVPTDSENFNQLTVTAARWAHVAVTYTTNGTFNGYVHDSGGPQVYNVAAGTTNIAPTTANLLIGNGCYSALYSGLMDEVRLSNTARSANWIQTEYNNQSSPGVGSFIKTLGTAQAYSDAGVFGADQSGTAYRVGGTSGSSAWQVQPNAGVDLFQASVAVQARTWSNAAFQTAYSDDVLFVPTRNGSATTNKL
ncbi:MAG: DUF2341 domain-containing protein, partial [Candidatus Methylomirabilales bacterium]